MIDPQASRMFLHSLWDGKPDESYILIWTLANKHSAWFQSVDFAADYVASLNSADIYTGVALSPRDYGPSLRCPSTEVSGISGLWADLDLRSAAHDKPLPETRADALALVPSWIQPTYTVGTGNGLQIWLLFREPWIFESEADRLAAANMALRFQTLIANRAVERGWVFERLADLARVLRVPGTRNLKDPRDPKQVETISNSGPRWNPSELVDLFDELNIPDPALEQIRAAGAGNFRVEPNPSVSQTMIAALMEADRTFRATWEQKRRNLKDPSPSGYDLALANIGVLAGLDDQAIVNLLIAWRERHGHPPKLRVDYYARTLYRVRSTLLMPSPGAIQVSVAAASPSLGSASAAAAAPAPRPVLVPAAAPDTAPPPDSKRGAALDHVRKALGLNIARVRKVRGEEPNYIVDLDDGRSIEMGRDDFFNQNRFAAAVYAKIDFAIPRFKEVQWRTVLGSLGVIMETVDRGSDLTAEGAITKYLLSYLAQTPFQSDALAGTMAMQRMYPLVHDGRIAVSATHLKIYVLHSFHEPYSVPAITAMLVKIGAKHWRERLTRKNEQARWLLPVEQFSPDDYVHPASEEKEEGTDE